MIIMNPSENKKTRIKIKDINDLKSALVKQGYISDICSEVELYNKIAKDFTLDNKAIENIKEIIKDNEITYTVKSIEGFIDYILKLIQIEECNIKLHNKISYIKKLRIDREEYQREPRYQEYVEELLIIVDNISKKVSEEISIDELKEIEDIEEKISKEYLYAKDIELLKKIIMSKKDKIHEEYDAKNKINTIVVEVPSVLDLDYIRVKKGSLEYYEHIKSNIPRMYRLIENIHKYIKSNEYDNTVYTIDHSSAVQDSINIAVATFNNNKFKAISGKTNIEGFCIAPNEEEEVFEACKVNKLGKLGIGYKRVNDSEKKILEQINKEIESKKLSDSGELVLYSRWEPCPSCYYVISQFCEMYPNINVKVKYHKEYGES